MSSQCLWEGFLDVLRGSLLLLFPSLARVGSAGGGGGGGGVDLNLASNTRLHSCRFSPSRLVTYYVRLISTVGVVNRLREAVQTERDNAQSLMKFEQREAAKKKTALRKTTFGGPVIRYVARPRPVCIDFCHPERFVRLSITPVWLLC